MRYTTKPFYKCSSLHISSAFSEGYCIKHNKEYFDGIDDTCDRNCFMIKVTTKELKNEWQKQNYNLKYNRY